MALRAALGASRGRLATDLCVEMGLLTVAAGAVGTALAWAGIGYVRAAGSAHFPRLSEISFDVRSWVLAAAATVVAGLAASVVPAIMGARLPLMDTLRAGGRTHATASERRRRTLIVAELTMSVVLVMSAGLLVRSLARQLGATTGFDIPHGLTFEVTLPPAAYPERQLATSMEHPKGVAYISAALEKIQAIPGVDAVAIGKPLPLSGAEEATSFVAEGVARVANAQSPVAQYTIASPGMLRALGTPLMHGREFTADDREDSPPVVVVNHTMADELWPGADALGKRIKLGGLQSPSPWMTVVGVATDIKRYSLTEAPRPEMIVPYTQKPYPTYATMQFIVRSPVSADALVPRIRAALGEIDQSVPMSRLRTLDELMGETSANARFATGFMGAFGIGALFLALVGLYSVVAFSVHQRRREFGLRRALGATGRGIVSLVMRDALRLTALGIVLGAVVSLGVGRLLRHALYQVSAFDVATVAATVGLLALGTLVACVTPAWRAARVDPRVAMEDGS
jgi:predicted permease